MRGEDLLIGRLPMEQKRCKGGGEGLDAPRGGISPVPTVQGENNDYRAELGRKLAMCSRCIQVTGGDRLKHLVA